MENIEHKNNKLKNKLKISKGAVISIVGAGGKTSFMFRLAEELREDFKVLVTTSTKIYKPKNESFDYIFFEKEEFNIARTLNDKGVYVLSEGINEDNKLMAISEEGFEKVKADFDIAIIEADGSKEKPLKGWNNYEPVIFESTTKTVGIIDITVLGEKVDEKIVHRMDEFLRISKLRIGNIINEEALINMIFNENGMFKNTSGEKNIFINKVETQKHEIMARNLQENILNNNKFKIENVIIGSLKQHIYF